MGSGGGEVGQFCKILPENQEVAWNLSDNKCRNLLFIHIFF